MKSILPPITLSTPDYDELVRLASLRRSLLSAGTPLLAAELKRAEVCSESKLPADVASLGSWVTYRTDASARRVTRRLTAADAARPLTSELSVLSPEGAALIGLRKGSAMRFHTEHGEPRWVKLEEVWQPFHLRERASFDSAGPAQPVRDRVIPQ